MNKKCSLPVTFSEIALKELFNEGKAKESTNNKILLNFNKNGGG